MDIVNHHTTLVPTLKKINGCRLYLEAQYISDIAHISGKTLTPGVFCGSTSNLSQSTLQWPNQSKPNDATRKVWKHFITQTFCLSAGKYDLQPQYILGCWLSKPSERNKIHRFQYYPSLNGIFISESNRIQRWYVSNIDINSIICIADPSDICRALPLDCITVRK